MCLIISGIFLYLSFSFYADDNLINALINGLIGIFFLLLLIRNIRKTIADKKHNNSTKI